ncbi:MAG: transcriptional antiterminator, Rof [Gammaproteobacteria bacterium]|nr:transcriptional antiterminator, Rof [Gammaproteobacteria bacterium]
MTDYTPIDCRTYGEFERAIIAGQRLQVSWRDADGMDHLGILVPVDLETCRGEEFLIARNERGEQLRLRLDFVRRATPVPAKP